MNLFKEHGIYLSLDKDGKNDYIKVKSITKNIINDYFDYLWIKDFTEDNTYSRDQLLKLAHLDEFLVDIKETRMLLLMEVSVCFNLIMQKKNGN